MNIRFDDKVAVVTGGSRGIGFAIALEFAFAGANVVLASRGEEDLNNAVEEIKKQAGNDSVIGHLCNVGKEADAKALIKATVDTFGRVDVLVNNAATNPYFGPMLDINENQMQKIFDVNVRSVLSLSNAASMLAWRDDSCRASIVNVASVAGLSVSNGIGFYGVSKAALIQLTKQLAHELGPKIRVNAIAPGLIKTDFSRPLWEQHEKELAKTLPMRRIGEPGDVAGAALFLASDYANWITGEVVVVDGGALVHAVI